MASQPVTSSPTSETIPETDKLSSSAIIEVKKARRQTAFYPNINSTNKPHKPFSRSAAKRESVMTLGSIEHLQHYFTKAGLSAKENPLKQNSNLVPAIGPGILVRSNSDLQVETLSAMPEEVILPLPPTPAFPLHPRPAFPPFIRNYQTDPDMLKPGVIEDLDSVARAWGIGHSGKLESAPHNPDLLGAKRGGDPSFDVLATLKTTTRAIRSVRNYAVALPDNFTVAHGQKRDYRPKSLSKAGAAKERAQNRGGATDILSVIRKAALEVLIVLRSLEERCRVPLEDDAYEVGSDDGSASFSRGSVRVASPGDLVDDETESSASFSFFVTPVAGNRSVAVWSDEEDDFNVDEGQAGKSREAWDERLVLGSGWLYKQDVTLEDLGQEREKIVSYLRKVDTVLFGGDEGDEWGWIKEKERMAKEGLPKEKSEKRIARESILPPSVAEEPETLMEAQNETSETEDDDSVPDPTLPSWAQRSTFQGDDYGRLHHLLTSLIPASLLGHLPQSHSRDIVLGALQTGQLLCIAYNSGVRRSKRGWGFIDMDAVHDFTTTKEEGREGGWTFRRSDNLRIWAAALKLRYTVPVVFPGSKSSSTSTPVASPAPSQSTFPPANVAPILFDVGLVARKDDGWEDMLEKMVLRWMSEVVSERRRGK